MSTQPSGHREVAIAVDGMSCSSCVRHVREGLAALPGVTEVEVSLEDGRAIVRLEGEGTAREALLQAVREAGYGAEIASGDA